MERNALMNNDLISREDLNKTIDGITWYHINSHGELVEGAFDDDALYKAEDIYKAIDNAPTVAKSCKELQEVANERQQGEFSRKDLESWLYQIAMNNIGTDFEKSVVEIIHRLDGFERFVSEQKGGAE